MHAGLAREDRVDRIHEYQSFETREKLEGWLKERHATDTVLWVRVFKKASAIPSVSWDDCVLACLAWGWIDGQRKSLDEVSFLQRLTPRRAGSNWSARNIKHAECLIAMNRMQPSGLVQVELARSAGRWGTPGPDDCVLKGSTALS